jgi:hypothetical protein
VTSRKARDRIRCTSEAVELVRGARCGVAKRRRAFGGSERGVLTCGAGGRAFEYRLIARRSSTAAVGAGTADVDDQVKGNGLRLRSVRPKIGRLPRGPVRPLAPASAAARRRSASLRTDYRKMEQDHDRNGVLPRKLHRYCSRRRRRPEPKRDGRPLDAWALNRRPSAAVARAEPVTDSGTRRPSAVLLRSHRSEILLISSRFRRRSEKRRSYVDASRRVESSAPKSESPRSSIEAHDTKNHRIDRSLAAKRQTLRGERQGPGAKDAPRRDLSNDTSIAAITREIKILRPKNRRKIDRFRPKFSKSAATMPATRASDERGNESDSQRPRMPGPERTVRKPIGPRRTQELDP